MREGQWILALMAIFQFLSIEFIKFRAWVIKEGEFLLILFKTSFNMRVFLKKRTTSL